MENHRVERLSEENILHLVALYEKVFRIRVSSGFLKRKYDTAKLGASYIGHICFSKENTPIAFYGVIPSIVRIDGQNTLAAQSADTMTDPDHQRQGLFLALARKTYELARNEGIQFIYGFPNEASHPGFKKLGWHFLPEQLQLFNIRVRAPLGALLSYLRPPSQKITDMILGPMQIAGARLFENESPSAVVHDETFIRYKDYNKTYCVELRGSRLWLKVDKSLKVGIAIPAEGQDARQFISTLKDLAHRLRCGRIFLIMSKSSALYPFLCTETTPMDAFPVGFYALSNNHPDFQKITFEYVDIDSF